VLRTLPLPPDLPVGQHTLSVQFRPGHADEISGRTQLIVCPTQCYEPEVIEQGARVWGIAVQLYTLRTSNNWGIGDFRDLRTLIDAAAPLHCSVIGLNPLHALMPCEPEHCSPYSPSNREFLNVLYIAVEDVPEYETAGVKVANELLAELRATPVVDYVRVAHTKLAGLRKLYAHFREHELAVGTARAQSFLEFVEHGGEPLCLHATYDALDEYLRARHAEHRGWLSWPDEYRDASSVAVQRFAEEHIVQVEFYLYLQWNAQAQLATAQRCALDRGMRIGLYGDVAVGANPAGSETWSNQRLYRRDAAIGAPPDPLALKGQDWGIPPQDPLELREQAYAPFSTLLENNMLPVAALRLDHVMSLFRLWWVPKNHSATEGVYVHYPLEELAAVLALESHRHRCVVIGEDLGTVPDEVRHEIQRRHIYSYKVLLFEKESDGRFKAPSAYESRALATVTTHDLPTLRGWWDGLDLALRDELNLYPNEEIRLETRSGREHDRIAMMEALVTEGLWHWQSSEPLPPYSIALARAIHCYLALSRANLALLQIEDLIGMTDPVNVPGTHTEHPNWQRKVTADLTDIFTRQEVREMLSAVDRARRGENPNG
jgi:4-alpha-glucanotransferase